MTKELKKDRIVEMYKEGFSAREIAEECDSSVNSVHAVIYKTGLHKEVDRIVGMVDRGEAIDMTPLFTIRITRNVRAGQVLFLDAANNYVSLIK